MSNQKQFTITLVLVWMAFNAVFFALEVTIFNDTADLNNSVLLILWLASMAALLRTSKIGYGLGFFTLIYAFAFNAFNLIYFSADLPFSALLINAISAVINAIAFVVLFRSLLQKSSP